MSYYLKIRWRKLTEEYIERFGFSDSFIEITRKQKEILRLKVQRMVDGDKSANTFIKICEEELSEMKGSEVSGNFWELKGSLDRSGFDIRPMETTVSEFYTHVKTLMKYQKAQVK